MTTKRFPGFLTLAAYVFAVASLSLGTGCSSSSTTTSADGGETDGTSSDAKMSKDSSHGDSMTGSTCSGGKMSCDGKCVDLSTSADNCGTCGSTCGTGLVCLKGTCALSCTGGDGGAMTQCGSGCFDLKTDSNNCGTCDHACGTGESCSNGVCMQSCGSGSLACASGCTDIASDNANCGGCSTAKASTACVSGTVCSGGKCLTTCSGNLKQCSGDAGTECVDFQSDVHNCGSCGNQCAVNSVCSAGQCQGSCTAPLVDCNGGCIDPTTNDKYCGATGSCGVDGGTAGIQCSTSTGQTCVASSCTVVCTTGQVLCGGKCINPQSDNTNCGASGSTCTGGMACGAGTVCTDGACKPSCDPGQIICGTTCVSPQTNPTFCGASGDCTGMNKGQNCPAGDVCSGGVCQLTCSPGFVECLKNGQSTCVQPNSDINFCGASGDCQNGDQGSDCTSTTQGFGTGFLCSGGACALTCTAGFVNCNNTCINPQTNNQYCGTSGSTPACSDGMQCPTGKVCTMGGCQTTCLAGEVECGGNCITPTTDSFYCGATPPTGTPPTGGGCSSTSPGSADYEGFNCSNTVGSTCGPDMVTGKGVCSCPANDTECKLTAAATLTCINASTSSTNCGCNGSSAGQNCTTQFGVGSTCTGAGTCSCPATVQGPDEVVCSVAATPTCVDQYTDNAFCGASGNCGVGNQGQNCTDPLTGIAGSNCSTGSCVCPVNPSDSVQEINCSSSCIDPSTSLTNCGGSGSCNTMDPPNTGNSQGVACAAIEICRSGQCIPDCAAHQAYCPGGAGNVPAAYCANILNDNNNCGTTPLAACGHMCTNGNSCTNGVCGPACSSVQTLCPSGEPPPNPATAYCANTTTDNNNCGTCNNVCVAPNICGSGHCVPPGVLELTTCGQTGPTGPLQSACDTVYAGSPLAGAVTVASGIQQWTVPVTGVYKIEAIGGQGAGGAIGTPGGHGADIAGTFTLTSGTVLSILVGQQGQGNGSSAGAGGGGGSFVVVGSTPLVVAGGGGGSWVGAGVPGLDGSLTANGVNGAQTVPGDVTCTNGGTSEGGGGPSACYAFAGCGGGFLDDGAAEGGAPLATGGDGGLSFVDGATGGINAGPSGGFGGGGNGGGGPSSASGGGGGGGYSGGGAGDQGGGGGSFNGGTSPSNTVALLGGDGVVFITVP